MKAYQEFMQEALAATLIKAAARHVLRGKTLAKVAQKTIPLAKKTIPLAQKTIPKQLKFGKVFHGTNTTASSAISKGGYRTDKNVTRQMMGPNTVSTSSDNYTAARYAMRAANKYGGNPAMRQLRVPQSVMKDKTTFVRQGTGDYSGKGYKMTTLSPQQATKYDITDKMPEGKYEIDVLMSPDNKKELARRVKTALKNKRNREVLKKEIDIEKELKRLYSGKGVGRKESL